MSPGKPTTGTVSVSAGKLIYTPPLNYNGSVTVTYTVQDNGTTDGKPEPKTAIGTLTITVTAVNDAPVGVDDKVSTPEDTPLVVPARGVISNDADVDSVSLSVFGSSAPASGRYAMSDRRPWNMSWSGSE